MATFTRGKTFAVDETVTNTKLHQLVDNGSISDVVRSDFNSVTSPVTASASALSTPQTGEIWFDTANVKMKVYNGTVWTEFSEFPWQHSNLVAETTSATAVSCAVGSTFRDSANTKQMEVTGSAQTAAITTSGKGGLDAGVEASSTWYAFLIIEDSNGVNAQDTLLVAEANYPDSITYPTGYDLHRRVMWVYNDASSDFQQGFQKGDKFRHYEEISAATSFSTTSWTDTNTLTATSPSSRVAMFNAYAETTGDGAAIDEANLFWAQAGKAGSSGGIRVVSTKTGQESTIDASAGTSYFEGVLDSTSNRKIAFRFAGTNDAISEVNVIGYVDSLAD